MTRRNKFYILLIIIVFVVGIILATPFLLFGYVRFMNKLVVHPVPVELLNPAERGFFSSLDVIEGFDYRQFATCRFAYCEYNTSASPRNAEAVVIYRDNNKLHDRSFGRVLEVLDGGYRISYVNERGEIEERVIKREWVLGKD